VIDNVHVTLRGCPFDLTHRPLKVFYLNQAGEAFRSIAALEEDLHLHHEHLLCATNGALFDVGEKPLGWLVVDGVRLHPLNQRQEGSGNFYLQPNGALVIDAAGASIMSTNEVSARELQLAPITIGLQSGPILIRDGVINPRFLADSTSRFTRNAVCLLSPAHGVLLYAPEPVSLFEFSQALLDFGCRDALYLDGHLSQMWPFTEPLDGAQRQSLATIVGVTQKDN
jgi:uncharacterized protein YigE (DUF2233 family)